MSSPYSTMPDFAYWQRSVSAIPAADIDPIAGPPPFQLGSSDRVMTAGSCFAQHIARYLWQSGFNVLMTEAAHPIATREIAEAYSFGMFTARYGNIYTARQLLQLFQRAYGEFQPAEDLWEEDGQFIDPFRPRIQPNGFASLEEYEADRRKHFAAVRQAFEELNVLVFTLGLTEAWRSQTDGAVFPLCPGVAGGTFDPDRHEFHNFTVDEIASDMLQLIDGLRAINPGAKILLTVSPVPLVATAEQQHVLVSTVYSKSVLRVAAGSICAARPDVVYFPSYEIITGSFSRGAYFGPDCRSVTEDGVGHVMRVFFRHFTSTPPQVEAAVPEETRADTHLAEMAEIVSVLCDEEMLDDRERRRAKRRAQRRLSRAVAAT